MSSRPIRFRAWHEKHGEMVEADTKDRISDKRAFATLIFDVGFRHFPDVDEWELMQFSGRHDVVGREVYESDIIEWITDPMTRAKRRGVVKFKDCMYEVESFGATVSLISVLSWGGVVIGDTFQNPELLEA